MGIRVGAFTGATCCVAIVVLIGLTNFFGLPESPAAGGEKHVATVEPSPVVERVPGEAERPEGQVDETGLPNEATEADPHEAAAGPEAAEASETLAAPTPEPVAERETPVAAVPAPKKRVGIQAGHWRSGDLPLELASLRNSTGTAGGGVAEWQLNRDVAERVATLLQAEGVDVDVLPATIPPGYQAEAFVALHADGNASGVLSGFKLARARWSAQPAADDALIEAITQEYAEATQMKVDTHVSRNMTGYYAFNHRRFTHAVAAGTPAVILEMGFMTNKSDLRFLLGSQDRIAEGIAQGVLRFLSTN